MIIVAIAEVFFVLEFNLLSTPTGGQPALYLGVTSRPQHPAFDRRVPLPHHPKLAYVKSLI
jgi:hypothetical protein